MGKKNLGNKDIHFSSLHRDEVRRKILQLYKSDGRVKVWVKNKNVKHEHYRAKMFTDEQNLVIKIIPEKTHKLLDQEILYNFVVKGVQYFGTGTIVKNKGSNICHLKISGSLYKCERRKNFRLNTSNMKNVRVIFTLENIDTTKKEVTEYANPDDTKVQEGLFRMFNRLLSKEDNYVGQDDQKYFLKVRDLSVTGLSFRLNELEYAFFNQQRSFKDFTLMFNEINFQIPKGNIVYINKTEDPKKKNVIIYKAGLEFIDLPENIEKDLSLKINEQLRELDLGKSFEEFIN